MPTTISHLSSMSQINVPEMNYKKMVLESIIKSHVRYDHLADSQTPIKIIKM